MYNVYDFEVFQAVCQISRWSRHFFTENVNKLLTIKNKYTFANKWI